MPVTRTRHGSHEISCRDCGVRVETYGDATNGDATAVVGGAPVSDTFRFVATRERWFHVCRTCERARSHAYHEARGGRGNRSTRRATTRAATALGLGRTFGVELEAISPVTHQAVAHALANAGLTGWRAKYDGSLPTGGVEVVSPVLTGEDGLEQIRRATRVMRDLGCSVSRACGTHVHHGVGEMRIDEIKRAARTWATHQRMIDGLVAPSRRNGINNFCRNLSVTDLSAIESARDLQSMRHLRVGRYRTFNLASYGRFGTVEIRQHQGTLDAEKVISWIRFGQAVLDTALVAPDALTDPFSRMRDLLSALGDRLDATARTFLTGRAVEFGAVAV